MKGAHEPAGVPPSFETYIRCCTNQEDGASSDELGVEHEGRELWIRAHSR